MSAERADPSVVRRNFAERQSRWLQERQAELDRKQVVAELTAQLPSDTVQGQHVTAPSDKHLVGNRLEDVRTEDVLDRLTERIANRIRSELRSQLEDEAVIKQESVAAENQQTETFLAKEIESHTCPICFELMVAPNQGPVLLFPCGHTFCHQCITAHMETHKKSHCPFCREKIKSKAPNYSLQQLIHNFVTRKEKRKAAGEAGPAELQSIAVASSAGSQIGSVDAIDEAARLQNELATKSIRYKVLMNELTDTEAEAATLEQNTTALNAVLQHLRSEETKVVDRFKAVQAELQVVQAHMLAQEEKIRAVAHEKESVACRQTIIMQTTVELHKELERLELVLAGLSELNM